MLTETGENHILHKFVDAVHSWTIRWLEFEDMFLHFLFSPIFSDFH